MLVRQSVLRVRRFSPTAKNACHLGPFFNNLAPITLAGDKCTAQLAEEPK